MLNLRWLVILLALILGLPAFSFSQTPSEAVKEKETSMYADFFDKNVYERFAQWFYVPRTVRKMLGVKKPSVNVNLYDEIPDSAFFTNRIGREEFTAEAIIKGPERTSGPDTQGPWLITKGKFEGITPGFFIRDPKGNDYLLKFDPPGYPELSSGAEAVVSRMMYAFGYNVPQYHVVYFDPAILQVKDGATYYGKSGFKKPLTLERVHEALKNVDRTGDGKIRASASLKIGGILKGPMSMNNYRKEDPQDYFRHRNRREFRVLQIFGSWVNNHDLRKGNTLDSWIQSDGTGYLKHYFIDFGSSFGSAGARIKDVTFTHEYFLDFGSIAKQALTLGLAKRDWEKRWEENGKQVRYPSIGYFDNRYFEAGKWKPEIPHFAFDDMTLGDAFWAAKIIMRLRPELLRQVMAVGQYSSKEEEQVLFDILVQRQKLIGQHWFSQVTPLDEFEIDSKQLDGHIRISFKDMEAFYGLSEGKSGRYRYRIVKQNSKQKKKLVTLAPNAEFAGSGLNLDLSPFKDAGRVEILIEKFNSQTGKWNPPVALSFQYVSGSDRFDLVGIWH